MSEWWSYTLSDFLMFSARAYWRQFELANRAGWPLQPLVILTALAWSIAARRSRERSDTSRPVTRLGAAGLAVCWAAVAWIFLHRHYAAINWAARALVWAFALQAAALALLAAAGGIQFAPPSPRRRIGLALIGWSLLGQPLLGLALGRPWTQTEWLGIAPDATLIATLGYLTLLQPGSRRARIALRALWAVPLAGCAVSTATLWTMGSAQAWVLPAAVAATLMALLFERRLGEGTTRHWT